MVVDLNSNILLGKIKVRMQRGKDIELAIAQELNRKLHHAAVHACQDILAAMRLATELEIRKSDTYQSLVTHSSSRTSLKAHFGLPDAAARLDTIIPAFTNGFQITGKTGFFKMASKMRIKSLKSKFTISFLPKEGWQPLYDIAPAVLHTEHGYILRWLKWLLIRGDDKELIRGYDIEFDFQPKYRSRTQLAIMVPRPAGRWGVPSQYAGMESANFLTQAVINMIRNNKTKLFTGLEQSFERHMR